MMSDVTVKDIAAALGKSERAIQLQAKRGKWSAVSEKVRGGRERRFITNLLPMEIRQKLALADANKQGLIPIDPARVPTTIPVQRPAPPERSQDLGLAKYRLVKAWRSALKAAPWGKKGEAADAFLLAYNTGGLLPGIYNQVGEIAEQTLRAMDRKLKKNGDDYVCLCDGRGGWKKHGTTKWRPRSLSEAAQGTLLKCYLNQRQPSIALSIRAARFALDQMEIEESASDGTFRRWLNDWRESNMHILTMAREGVKAYEDKYGPYMDRDWNQIAVGDLLVADGKVTNFHILHPRTGKPVRMTWVNWMDCRSRYIVGWQIMPTENAIAILAAFRMAVLTLGKIPGHVLMDNGKAFKAKIFHNIDPDFEEMTGLYARLGTCVHFSKAYKGRTKINERFHLTMQEQAERLFPSYIGSSIEDKPAHMHRNEVFHQRWMEAETGGWVPTIQEASMMIQAYLGFYAREPHSGLGGQTPLEVLEAGRGPGVDVLALNKEFLWRTVCTPKRCRVTLAKIDYESDALHGVKHKVIAMYSTSDMGQVYLYTPDGAYMGEALPVKAAHPIAQAFGDTVSADLVAYENKRQARLKKDVKKAVVAIGGVAEDLLGVVPYKPEKQPVIRTTPARLDEPETPALPDAEVKRLEIVAEQAATEGALTADAPERPAFFTTDQDRYEWCFYTLYRDGYQLPEEDLAFMSEHEASRDFVESHRERFDDLREMYAPQQLSVGS